jgi:YidC/Oxa1 family membrane protein insertase
MDRTTILVFALLLAAAVGYTYFYYTTAPSSPSSAAPQPPTASRAAPPAAPAAAPTLKPPSPTPSAAEKTWTLKSPLQDIEFTSHGAAIKRVVLHQRDDRIIPEPMELTSLGAMNLMSLSAADEHAEQAPYELIESESDNQKVVFATRTPSKFQIKKTFSISGEYQLLCSVTVTNLNDGTATFDPFDLNLGIADTLKGGSVYDAAGVDWHNGKTLRADVKLGWFDPFQLLFFTFRGPRGLYRASEQRPGEPIYWAATKNQYFATIVTPLPAHRARDLVARPVTVGAQPNGAPHRVIAAALSFDAVPLPGGGAQTLEFHIFSGPKEYSRLVALSKDARFGRNQDEVLEFGSLMGLVAVPLLKSLLFLGKWVGGYGVAIIVITILIKLIFWPVTAASMKSMKRMQKFQPLINQLREKYRDDPQKLNQEMMALYREHKINPLGGCLPMLVQIPVFIGLFTMLRSAIELRGARFLWIADLSQPDTVFSLFGLPVNPLPLLMTATMIWQQKITPTTMDPKQAKLMLFMPVVFLVFFYNASSGLALYWTVQGLLSVGQQYWMNMKKEESESALPPPAVKSKKDKKRRTLFPIRGS